MIVHNGKEVVFIAKDGKGVSSVICDGGHAYIQSEYRLFAGSPNISAPNTLKRDVRDMIVKGKSIQKAYALTVPATVTGGVKSYINTGFIPNQNTKYEMEIFVPSSLNDSQFMEARNSSMIGIGMVASNLQNVIRFRYGSQTNPINSVSIPKNNAYHRIVQDGRYCYADGNLVYTFAAETFSAGYPFWLFWINSAGNFSDVVQDLRKIKSCKIWDNGALIRDFISVPQGNTQYSKVPAPSNCMWDKVTQTYFENAGTGSFGIEEITPSPANPILVQSLGDSGGFNVIVSNENTSVAYPIDLTGHEPIRSEIGGSGVDVLDFTQGKIIRYDTLSEEYISLPQIQSLFGTTNITTDDLIGWSGIEASIRTRT